MYQTIGELPQAHRDTLAFLVLHLQRSAAPPPLNVQTCNCQRAESEKLKRGSLKSCRVADSLDTLMDISNLARVFGPTIVGHAVPNPDPMTILQDTKRQPKVGQTMVRSQVSQCPHSGGSGLQQSVGHKYNRGATNVSFLLCEGDCRPSLRSL